MKRKLKKANIAIRAIAAIFVIASLLLFYREFGEQFACYFTGQASIIKSEWHIVVLNIVLFLLLLLPLSFRRKANWGEYGLITAFFVSLFIEMYGFPLTIYFISNYFTEPVACAKTVLDFELFGVRFGMEVAMIYTSFLIFIGTLLIIVGWVTLYKNRNHEIVARGIYKYSRHPQYLGFILIILGWFLDWPTLITIVFAPVLIFVYIRVCRIEEKEILKKHPEYQQYIDEVPFFL